MHFFDSVGATRLQKMNKKLYNMRREYQTTKLKQAKTILREFSRGETNSTCGCMQEKGKNLRYLYNSIPTTSHSHLAAL
jgi:hypothetical protein